MYGGKSRTGSSLKTQPKYVRWAHLMQSQLEMERPPRDGDLQVWPLPRALSTYVYVQVNRPRWTPLGENHERWFWDRANEAALRRIKSRLFSDALDLAIEYSEQVSDARARWTQAEANNGHLWHEGEWDVQDAKEPAASATVLLRKLETGALGVDKGLDAAIQSKRLDVGKFRPIGDEHIGQKDTETLQEYIKAIGRYIATYRKLVPKEVQMSDQVLQETSSVDWRRPAALLTVCHRVSRHCYWSAKC